MIRPQGLHCALQGEGVEGLVTQARFQGDDVRCSVMFKGLEEPVIALISSASAPPKGGTAWFKVNPQHVFVFESDRGDPISEAG